MERGIEREKSLGFERKLAEKKAKFEEKLRKGTRVY